MYTSPFIIMYIYKRGFFTVDEMKSLGRFFGGLTCILAFSFLIRGLGRANSDRYVKFIKALRTPMTDRHAYLDQIRKYDFDVKAWPVTYTVSNRER